MVWKGRHPTVKRLHGEYRDGVRVPAKEMKEYEARWSGRRRYRSMTSRLSRKRPIYG